MRASSTQIRRFSEVRDRNAVIHADGFGGNDYTLCGMATDGEDGSSLMLVTRRTVTCADCVGIINYCKSIPTRVYRRRALPSQDHGEKS
jgi:hypothetical protein